MTSCDPVLSYHTLTCRACAIVPNVLFCTPMVAKASCTNLRALGTEKLVFRIPDILVATKPARIVYYILILIVIDPTCIIIPLPEYSY